MSIENKPETDAISETAASPEAAEVIETVEQEPVAETPSDTSTSQKGGGFFQNVWTATGAAGKKFFNAAQGMARDFSEQQQIRDHAARLKKYNPLFEDEYRSTSFKLPNLITIVDSVERKNVDVCEGAMAYRMEQKGVEVLYLYDDALPTCGLRFVPTAMCGSVYYVDPHDHHRYITVDGYFSVMKEEKLAELQHIAYSLGASRYWVEMVEDDRLRDSKRGKGGVHITSKASVGASAESETTESSHSKMVAEAVFSGKRRPVSPSLCWYAQDRNVLNLIEMRCSGRGKDDISTYTIELTGVTSMSRNTAAKVEAAVCKIGASCGFSSESDEEHSRRMFFRLEF